MVRRKLEPAKVMCPRCHVEHPIPKEFLAALHRAKGEEIMIYCPATRHDLVIECGAAGGVVVDALPCDRDIVFTNTWFDGD